MQILGNTLFCVWIQEIVVYMASASWQRNIQDAEHTSEADMHPRQTHCNFCEQPSYAGKKEVIMLSRYGHRIIIIASSSSCHRINNTSLRTYNCLSVNNKSEKRQPSEKPAEISDKLYYNCAQAQDIAVCLKICSRERKIQKTENTSEAHVQLRRSKGLITMSRTGCKWWTASSWSAGATFQRKNFEQTSVWVTFTSCY